VPHAYLNFLNKGNGPFKCKCQFGSVTLSVFVDAGEILVMADDVAMPSNPPVAPVEQEELEEMPLDVNVSQRPREEEPSRRVVHTRVDCSAWDR
jgi:hypothetical protein